MTNFCFNRVPFRLIFACTMFTLLFLHKLFRICGNTLCKITVGSQEIREHKDGCAGGVPIRGRYVTLQRFKTPVFDKESLALGEIDIEFYVWVEKWSLLSWGGTSIFYYNINFITRLYSMDWFTVFGKLFGYYFPGKKILLSTSRGFLHY